MQVTVVVEVLHTHSVQQWCPTAVAAGQGDMESNSFQCKVLLLIPADHGAVGGGAVGGGEALVELHK